MPRTKLFDEQEVLMKAVELFWKKGFHATSIQDLVNALGINRASLYDTFGGKDQLFKRAIEAYKNKATIKLQSFFDEADTIKKGFKNLFNSAIKEVLNDTCRKGCFIVNTATELESEDSPIHDLVSSNMQSINQLFIYKIKEGIKAGEFKPKQSAKDIGTMLFTLYNGLSVVGKIDNNPARLKTVVKTSLSVLDI